jgi:hypothetical protein
MALSAKASIFDIAAVDFVLLCERNFLFGSRFAEDSARSQGSCSYGYHLVRYGYKSSRTCQTVAGFAMSDVWVVATPMQIRIIPAH